MPAPILKLNVIKKFYFYFDAFKGKWVEMSENQFLRFGYQFKEKKVFVEAEEYDKLKEKYDNLLKDFSEIAFEETNI